MAALRFKVPQTRKARIDLSYDLTLALLLFLLPLSSALPNLLLIPLGLLVYFKYASHKVDYRRISLFLISIAYLILLASIKFSLIEEIEFYSRLLMLLLLVIIVPQVSDTVLVKKAFLTGVFAAIIIACFNILKAQGFVLSFHSFGNTASVNELLRIERPYFGFLLALAVFFLLKSTKFLAYIPAGIATLFCIMIAARLSLGLIVILWIVKGYRLLGTVRKFRIPILLGAVLLAGALLFNNENLRDRFKIAHSVERSIERALDFEPRYVIWPCTLSVLETTRDVFTGLHGNKELKDRLTACYAQSITDNPSKKAYYLSEQFNPHNQFLHFLDLAGLGAFILLVAAFIQVFISSKVSASKKLFLVLFMFFFLVETVLFRQLGCYVTGIGLGYIARKEDFSA